MVSGVGDYLFSCFSRGGGQSAASVRPAACGAAHCGECDLDCRGVGRVGLGGHCPCGLEARPQVQRAVDGRRVGDLAAGGLGPVGRLLLGLSVVFLARRRWLVPCPGRCGLILHSGCCSLGSRTGRQGPASYIGWSGPGLCCTTDAVGPQRKSRMPRVYRGLVSFPDQHLR
jgi:hypothetical protein